MPERFVLATFNLENLDDRPAPEASLESRVAALRPQVERLDADVLCLQEVNGQPRGGPAPRRFAALDVLLEGTPLAGFHRAVTESPSGGAMDKHNLVVLSRWPIVEQRQVWHELVPAPRAAMTTAAPPEEALQPVTWDRPLLAVTIELPGGRPLHVLNLHLRAPLAAFVPGQKTGQFAWASVAGWAEGFALAAMKRNGQALEARLWVEKLFDAEGDVDGPLVAVCGDFNAEATEVPTRILRGDVEDTGSGALAARALVPVDMTMPPDRRYTVIHAGRRNLLDHLLVSRPLLRWFRGAEIHNEGLGDELVAYATVDRSPESYHAPVVARFELPGGQSNA